jgi:RNA polymerase sigma factor (sigma-70 family)
MVTDYQQALISALKQPDIELPVQQLYDHYFEGIIAQICMNGGSREDGADVFQDAVLVLVEKVKTGTFRGDSSIKTFLSAIARNLWLFELRTRERRKKRELRYVSSEETVISDSFRFNDTGIREKLMETLTGIGDACKKILTGFYYEKKSMKELLEEFDYGSEQVLRNKKSKCMKKLKEIISENKELTESLKTHPLYE